MHIYMEDKKTRDNANMIKGRIAETIFEEMFSEGGNYTIIPFGYEKITPALAKAKRDGLSDKAKEVVANISSAPDYALIKNKNIFLVEVKFFATLTRENVFKLAEDQKLRWNPSWLFVVTRDGFYFGECSRIIKYKDIQRLSSGWISNEAQQKFLELVKKFEK